MSSPTYYLIGNRMVSYAKVYAQVFGTLFISLASLELIFQDLGHLIVYSPVHNSMHWAIGILGMVAGYSGRERWVRAFSQMSGFVFSMVIIMEVFAPDMLGTLIGYRMNWVYGLLNVLAATVGFFAGFSGQRDYKRYTA